MGATRSSRCRSICACSSRDTYSEEWSVARTSDVEQRTEKTRGPVRAPRFVLRTWSTRMSTSLWTGMDCVENDRGKSLPAHAILRVSRSDTHRSCSVVRPARPTNETPAAFLTSKEGSQNSTPLRRKDCRPVGVLSEGFGSLGPQRAHWIHACCALGGNRASKQRHGEQQHRACDEDYRVGRAHTKEQIGHESRDKDCGQESNAYAKNGGDESQGTEDPEEIHYESVG